MTFAWQQSRSEALYVEQESNRIYGFVAMEGEHRMKINAMAVSDRKGREFKSLGTFFTEQAAKQEIEGYINSITIDTKVTETKK